MKSRLFVAAAAIAATVAGSANAAQYITQLEWDANGLHTPSYGTVTITEVFGAPGLTDDYVNVKVEFGSLVDEIVDTGNGHVAFAFNLNDSPNSTVHNLTSGFTYAGEGSFMQSPFGTFSNAIVCCGKGASNGLPPVLEFNVKNTAGIHFVTGASNLFTSNSSGTVGPHTGGWWFAVDTYDAGRPSGGNTYAVAGRDFCTVGVSCTPGVPEPATWAMMIMGFGSAGAVLRRRRGMMVPA